VALHPSVMYSDVGCSSSLRQLHPTRVVEGSVVAEVEADTVEAAMVGLVAEVAAAAVGADLAGAEVAGPALAVAAETEAENRSNLSLEDTMLILQWFHENIHLCRRGEARTTLACNFFAKVLGES